MRKRELKWDFCRGLGQMATRSQGTEYRVNVIGDPFAPGVRRAQADYLFAVIASRGSWMFTVVTRYPRRMESYMDSVERRAVGAAEKYERRVKAHFRRYKMCFREGYTLPGPPTPEMRVVYDSAAKWERRPRNPCGTTLASGFSLGEYHWRSWPLNNVSIRVEEAKLMESGKQCSR